ncbi:hypothetical protein SAMN04487906_1465 [Zhouia amylolytica]|uniref:Uncharacterized protein n=1 Tax=Zhouia amylolytica TaxID=376730 RepID=A0A1I6S7W4_9FLAO|nr:hypothetical protein [Zhouia amylolytica]SFS73055.1 hypothetical protein SAMN04487906_1465 [Zhouia amylolytica]
MKNNKKIDWRYYLIVFCLVTFTLSVYLFQWFGPGIISYYKQKKEKEQIFYGGSKEEAEASIELYNNKVITLKKAVDSTVKANQNIYVFTNDTTNSINSFSLSPNIKFSKYQSSISPGNPLITRNKDIIEKISTFLKHEDSLGYSGSIKKGNHTLTIKHYRGLNDSLVFKLITYFKPTPEYNDRPIIKSAFKISSVKVDSFKTRSFKYKEKHLKNLKENSGFSAAILRPYYKSFYDNSFKFYFVCLNQNIPKDAFQKYIDYLLEGSLKELDCSNCHIKTLKAKINDGLKTVKDTENTTTVN